MESIELLKQEILNQKTAIESKGGVVNIANLNPSPAEITQGINSIVIPEKPNFSQATATEADVAVGKTFYAGEEGLKTGSNILTADYIDKMYLSKQAETTLEYTIPSGTTVLRKYAFYENPNTVNFTFNEDLESIMNYAFANIKNFNFLNFHDLQNLKVIEDYGFTGTNLNNIDIGNLPNSIEIIGGGAFRDSVPENASIRFPANLQEVGQNLFYNTTQKNVKDIDFTNYPNTTLLGSTLYNLLFDSDLIVPEGILEIGTYFNYNGCFKNVELPSTLTALNAYAFGALNATPSGNFYLKSITFNRETPPTINRNAISTKHLDNGLKIYVPDTAVEAYKALTSISSFSSVIYPISQKE